MTQPLKPRLSREDSRARTRALLLGSARTVFSKHGYVGASIDEIAESAGFSKGAFYSNFSTKEEIFLELLAVHMRDEAQMLGEFLSRANNAQGVPELLKEIGDLYRLFETDVDWGLLVLEFNLQAGRDAKFFETFSKRFVDHRAKMADLVEGLFKLAGAKMPCSSLDLAIVLIAVSYGIPVQRLAFPASIPRGALGNTIEMLLASLLKAGMEPEKRPKSPAKKVAAPLKKTKATRAKPT
ncbi:TetR/AcrR family transcriptional regulator [Ramlibacter sp. WS9]|uniref:TetR/AcrR family transcriptional regulator n=1 Tax=Ramlibacter sp. WS9 TaxID=1882741 RepID=UPI0018EE81DC|nr:TetR/AcrR family transcriptional regulator [Ramlibacter sp. WS9]